MSAADRAEDRYTHGHDDAVLSSHRWRTVENSARYLVPHLRGPLDLLDVGCGPGSLTADLARHLDGGSVLGVDRASSIVEDAATDHPAGAGAVLDFAVADAYDLALGDRTFDVVHAHQVLQHLTDPVAALREWRNVLRPGGLVAVRDVDFATMVFGPNDPVLQTWNERYHAVTAANGATANAGRMLATWVASAGYVDAIVTSSSWTFATAAERSWWGTLWAARTRSGTFADQAVSLGVATQDELDGFAQAFERWSLQPTGTCVMVHVEVVARNP